MTGYENLCMNCMAELAGAAVCPKCGSPSNKPQMRHALPCRTLLQRRYIVGQAERANGEGVVYTGYDTVLNITIAIHEFFPQTLSQRMEDGVNVCVLGGNEVAFDECLSKFLVYARETAHLRELSAIEQIYDIFEENHTAYTVSERNESTTLRRFVEHGGGRLSWNTARQLFMPVLSALSAMNSRGIRHLGISPDTLQVQKDGKMKLTGFCIDTVRRMDTDLPPDMVAGCAAIEQYVTGYGLDEATDVYGFSASLFFALVGFLPQDALKRRVDSSLLIPTGILRTLPPHVVTALANALQLSPEKRTKTFERLRAELSAAPTVTAKLNQPPEPLRPPPPQKKRGVPGFVWAFLSCIIALAIFVRIGMEWLMPEDTSTQAAVESGSPASSSSALAQGGNLPENASSSAGITAEPADRIEVPNFVGQEYESLVSSEASGQNDYEIYLSDKQFSDTVPEGQIISQSPESGQMVDRGVKIVVVVSRGKAMRTLPDIAGSSLADASMRVTEAGFIPVKSDAYSNTVPSGQIIGYKDYKAGDKVSYNSQVTILLSKGPQPAGSQ